MLRVSRKVQGKVIVHRTFECMGDQSVLITVKLDQPKWRTNSPFHWFLADNRKPALDVSVEPSVGILREITYFIDAPLSRLQLNMPQSSIEAIPLFETALWEEPNQYYVEQLGEVDVGISGEDIVLAVQGCRLDTVFLLDLRFGVLVDHQEQLAGFLIKSITDEEWNALRNSGLI